MSNEAKSFLYSFSILLISIVALAYMGIPGLLGVLTTNQAIKTGGA